MTNSPNRRKGATPAKNPDPAQVQKLRKTANLTLAEAGLLLHTTGAVFNQWETDAGMVGHRRMHPAFWELFQLKVVALIEWRAAHPKEAQ